MGFKAPFKNRARLIEIIVNHYAGTEEGTKAEHLEGMTTSSLQNIVNAIEKKSIQKKSSGMPRLRRG